MAVTINGSTNNSNWTFKLVATENSTNVANNTSSLTVTAYIGRSSSAGSSYMYGASISCPVSVTGCSNQTISYNNSGTVTIAGGGWLNIGSKTFTVPHNSDGSKSVTISASFSNNVSPSSGSASGSMNLTKIPRASSVSCTNANIGSNATINIARYSNSFTHTLTYSFGNLTGTIATKTTSTSISWTIPTTFYAKIPNNNSGIGTITCTTYSGNTNIGSKSCSFTAYVTNSNPIFSDFEYEDVNATTLALTGNSNTIIKSYSKIRATVSTTNKATAQNSATMSYYQLENTKGTYSSDSDVVIEVANFSNVKVNVSAVDSRGNVTTVSKTISNFIDYSSIVKDSLTLTRSNNGVGKFVTATFNGVFWNDDFGDVTNSLSISYFYKKTTETNWTTGTTSITPTILDNTFSFSGLIAGDEAENGFEIQNSYDVKIIVSDELSNTTFTGIIGAGTPAIAVYGNKASIGNKYDTSLGGTQLWGDVYVNSNELDYVVASGTSNGWIYRKWKSGLAECWLNKTISGGDSGTTWGALYPFSVTTGEINYPFAFVEIPNEVANISRSGTNACFLYKESGTSNTTTHTANYRPAKAAGVFANQTITISIQVVGKWK